ncbi:MAG: hypothetical protein Q8O00_11155 [Holophaga sp.]|nr:hypothetical protein [Holophaga sp.]
MLRVFALSLLLLILISGNAFAQNCGWGPTKWGMSVEDVQKATQLKLTKTSKASDEHTFKQYSAKLNIHAVPYKAKFVFSTDNELHRIEFELDRDTQLAANVLRNLRQDLVNKYGAVADSEKRSSGDVTFMWVSKCSIISLALFPGAKSGNDLLYLTYEMNLGALDNEL